MANHAGRVQEHLNMFQNDTTCHAGGVVTGRKEE